MNPSVMLPPDSKFRPPFGLTRRQFEVMEWADEGKTNEEIGVILTCATATVKKHVQEVFRKLGVENRMAAVKVLRFYFRKSDSANGH